MEDKHVEIGEIDLPIEYIKLTKEQKDDLCFEMIEFLMQTIIEKTHQDVDPVAVLNLVLESSIMVNAQKEQYEICAFLKDMKTLLNE